MSHVFMPRIFEPPSVEPSTPSTPSTVWVMITGEGGMSACSVNINGTNYSKTASTNVMTGDTIEFIIWGNTSSYNSKVTIDGTVVATSSSSKTSYTWTVPSGITNIGIVLYMDDSISTITVTTS